MTAARLPDDLIAEIRARTRIEDLVSREVRLTKAGAWRVGLCPFHGERNPSFAVRPDTQNFHCFGCGAHGDVFGWVMLREGRSFRDAALRLAADAGIPTGEDPAPRRALPPPPPPPPPHDREEDRRLAWSWWNQGRPIEAGSPQAEYLAGRALWPLPAGARALRAWDARHPQTGEVRHPVLLAAVQDADGRFSAVHRTFLAPREGGGWGKLPHFNAKLGFGPWPAGCAIRLMPAGDVLAVAEGIETALAAHRLFGVPAWATISAQGMQKFVPPPGVKRLMVMADRDKPMAKPPRPEGTGIYAARILAGRARAAGLEVDDRVPVPPAEDYADVWTAMVESGKAA